MTDIYKELDEEIALAGGIDKLVQLDIAKMKRQDRMLQGLRDEAYRRTKVKLLLSDESEEPEGLEDAINEFLYDRECDCDSNFRLIDIKFIGTDAVSEALIIYSEIDKPREEGV